MTYWRKIPMLIWRIYIVMWKRCSGRMELSPIMITWCIWTGKLYLFIIEFILHITTWICCLYVICLQIVKISYTQIFLTKVMAIFYYLYFFVDLRGAYASRAGSAHFDSRPELMNVCFGFGCLLIYNKYKCFLYIFRPISGKILLWGSYKYRRVFKSYY